jgi:hypothetical protein
MTSLEVVFVTHRMVLVAFLFMSGAICTNAQPDLIIWGQRFNPWITATNFSSTSCEVIEGCAVAGARRLMIFETETRNIGNADLFLGNPANNPLFEYQSCHGHYHFRDFANYQLVDASGGQAALGLKVGFCLIDSHRWEPNAAQVPIYDCEFQGLQAGWGDVYGPSIPCQWIDISSVAPGVYTLHVEVDPENRLTELNETNNAASQFVVIDGICSSAPPNDAFASAQLVQGRMATILGSNRCATRQNNEPAHGGATAAKSIWYRWVPNYTGDATITTIGSTFDTVLAAYRGSALGTLTSVASNNDAGFYFRWSSITFRVTNSVPQLIAVDGAGGAAGGLALNINPAGNDHLTNCLVISGSSGTTTGINIGATTEPSEAANLTHGARSVWYCWTAPASDLFRFHTAGSSFDTRLTVYQGTAFSNLTKVASNDDALGIKTSALSFNAVANNTYLFAVTSPSLFANPGEGLVTLTWEPAVDPRITSIVRTAVGVYRLSITGQTNDQYSIQFSSDLGSWVDRGRVTNSVGVVTYNDTPPGGRGFYRLLLLQ